MQKFGLLGRKLAHSYSPAIHAAFGGYDYALFEVEPEDLTAFMTTAGMDFGGLNVTIPYKQDVIPFCHELSPTAQAIGSVNTLIPLPGGGFSGENTDAAGFTMMLEQSGLTIAGKKALVIGNGGSSLTVCHVLRTLGASEIVVVSIKDNHPDFLARHTDAAIMVNTSPVGMYPHTGIAPVALDIFPLLEGVLDLIYNPTRTQLMMDAAARGLVVQGGLTMLVGQAAAASEMFTGRPIGTERVALVEQELRRKMENIILIGMPGCGKSTIGRMLAEKLGRTFIDADVALATSAGCDIQEIFKIEGEEGFRKRETEILRQYGKESGLIIATGGGCVTRAENYPLLHQNGTIIFVERDIALLAREGRPLSQGNLQTMYENRLPLYRRFADKTVYVNSSPQMVAEKIIGSVNE